jgi:peptidoglycan/xylan/chitin deacetylase (PgdA/CDA1 family)
MGLVAGSSWRRERLLILCYHWLSYRDEHLADPTYITPDFFRRRLQRLRDGGFAVLPLREALDRLNKGTLPSKAVAITFDDGTRDFADLALPILREFSMPATVYVTTYYCENLVPVFDIALRYLLWKGRADSSVVASVLGNGAAVAPGAGRNAIWQAIYDHARKNGHSASQKQDTLRRVAQVLGVDFDDFMASGMFQQMTPEQVRDLPRDLIDVQLHTHRHRTPRVRAEFVREIRDNRECLQRYLGGGTLEHFCYPSGDYWGEFLGWLREERVQSATTCVPGIVSRNDPALLLPRFLDSSGISDVLFDSWTSGFSAFLPRRRKHRADPTRLVAAPAGS